jgi:hypothetical protein
MRHLKRLVVCTVMLLVLALSVLISCGGTGGQDISGTWTLTTNRYTGDEEVGDGTFTISFVSESTELERTFYSGEAEMSTNGTPTTYRVSVEQRYGESGGSGFYLYLCDDLSNKFAQSIRMEGTLSGSSSASGTYEGIGTEYEKFGTGDFVATKQ